MIDSLHGPGPSPRGARFATLAGERRELRYRLKGGAALSENKGHGGVVAVVSLALIDLGPPVSGLEI